MVSLSEDQRRTTADDVAQSWWRHRLFLDHPHAAGQTYLQHMAFAGSVGSALLRAALAAFVHGAIPACFETYAGDTIRRLHAKLPNAPSRASSAHLQNRAPRPSRRRAPDV